MRRSRSQTIKETEWFILSKNATSKPGKKSYTIRVKKIVNKVATLEAIKQHFDPYGNRGSRYGTSWKYNSLKDAEQLLMWAIVKWGLK